MTNKNLAVIGLGFGDEGKGLTTNFLCQENPTALVVRYSGGQQAGHTVVVDGIRHVFSNFGAGTLNGNPTYWSKYCTVDPLGIYNELNTLKKIGINPTLFIDAKCPVTTPFEKELNKVADFLNGTCGVGVGTTHEREGKNYSLLFEDLFFPTVFNIKLEHIRKFYNSNINIEGFLSCVQQVIESPSIMMVNKMPISYVTIFEGSQGLLLDQHSGFFPNVTRSNVGTLNIMKLTKNVLPDIYAITRAYQTRHGFGPMTNTDFTHKILDNSLETNVSNNYQGHFRKSILDVELLEYAITKDLILKNNRSNLVVTCLDHIINDYSFTYKGKIYHYENENSFLNGINDILKFSRIFISHSDKSEDMVRFL